MKMFPNICRRLADKKIVAIGYDENVGFAVIELEGGASLLISADWNGYHIIQCESQAQASHMAEGTDRHDSPQ